MGEVNIMAIKKKKPLVEPDLRQIVQEQIQTIKSMEYQIEKLQKDLHVKVNFIHRFLEDVTKSPEHRIGRKK